MKPSGREGLELLVGIPVLAALAGVSIPLGWLAVPDLPWFLAGILGCLFVFGGLVVLMAVLGLAMAVGSRILDALNLKPKPWDGTGAPDDL